MINITPIIDSIKKIDQRIPFADTDLLIVFDGDSLTQGVGATNTQDYPNIVKDILTPLCKSIEFYSYGISGQTVFDLNADAATQIYTKVNHAKVNVLIAWADVNTILNDNDGYSTADETIADFGAYFGGAKTAGYDLCFLNNSYYPRLPYNKVEWADHVDEQHLYFEKLKSGQLPTGVDRVNDLILAPNIGGLDRNQAVNSTYFNDSVHLKTPGYQEVANYVYSGLLNYFK